jgi:hypothetical protein
MTALILVASSLARGEEKLAAREDAILRRAELQRQVEELRESAPRKRSVGWKVSAALLAGAMAADAGSSWRRLEANPLVAGGDGRFGWRGAALKGGVLGGVLAAQWLIGRRVPGTLEAFRWTNYTTAGALTGVAIRNWSTR